MIWKIAAIWILCGLTAGAVIRSQWRKKEGRNKFVVRWGTTKAPRSRKRMKKEIAKFIVMGPIGLFIQVIGAALVVITRLGGTAIDYFFRLK